MDVLLILLILFLILFNILYLIPKKIKDLDEKISLHFKELNIRINRLEKILEAKNKKKN